MQEIGRETRLRHALKRVASNYDYVIIDCPPSLNMLTVNALVASDGVLIPMQCEYYALEGLSALNNTIKQIAKLINPKLKIEGILRTMYDPRSSLTNAVSAQLRKYFGDRVYRVSIPRNVRLAEAPSHGCLHWSMIETRKDQLPTWHWLARYSVKQKRTAKHKKPKPSGI